MDKDIFIEILIKLRSDSILANSNPTEDNFKELIHKYDMLFLGEKFNTIYSVELNHALKNHFRIDSNIDELNELIPNICDTLKMKYEPLVYVENVGKADVVDCYKIILWE